MYEQILIRVSGKDRAGLTASLMEILARYDTQILDIGQAVIHSSLSLGILIRIAEKHSGQVMKELLFKATDMDVNIGFAPVTDDEYDAWVGRQGKNRYILTIIGRSLSAAQIGAAAQVATDQGLNIDSIRRLTGRMSLRNPAAKNVRACIEFSLRGTPADREKMQAELMHLSGEMGFDFSLQKDDMYRRMRRLICFDMDSTLIQTECIDELADRAGVGKQVRAITESAMRGEIDFKESFTRRVALLKGLDASVMQEIADKLPITEGVERLMSVLKTCGYKIAILSGGFTFFGELRYNANIEDIECSAERNLTKAQLAEIGDCSFIRRAENVLITGLTGCGKSFLACALGRQACYMGLRTEYLNMNKFIERIALSKLDGTFLKVVTHLERNDLIILDDFGLQPLDMNSRLALLQILEERYDRKSMIIVSQLPLDKWYDYIAEPTLADAIMDRLVNNSIHIELKGESMRRKKKK